MKTMKEKRHEPSNHIKGENYGEFISEGLSELLKNNSDKDDRILASQNTGVSYYTITNVARRANPLTESNSLGIAELIRITISRCKGEISDFNDAIVELENVIQKEAV